MAYCELHSNYGHDSFLVEVEEQTEVVRGFLASTFEKVQSQGVSFVRELLGRSDFAIIGEIVEPKTRVLDLGCGEGELLAWLEENKDVDARGVEMSGAKVQKAIARGVSVYPGRSREGAGGLSGPGVRLRDPEPDAAGDALSARVLREMLRVGRRAIVAFPNFGHWRCGCRMLLSGRAPRTTLFPYDWYDSPNIHFLTVLDFEALAALESLVVERRYFLAGHRKVELLPNLLAEVAVFLVTRRDPGAQSAQPRQP